jgi:arginase family enzyme
MNAAAILNSTFVTVPALRIEDRGQTVVASNLATGTVSEFGREILDILQFFRRPQPLNNWLARPGTSAQSIFTAVSNAFLTDVDRMVAVEPVSIGQAIRLSHFLGAGAEFSAVVFGAPVDGASTGRGGARRGPSEIRSNIRLPFPGFGGADSGSGTDADTVYLDFETRRHYSGSAPRVADLGSVVPLPGESIGTYGPRISLLTDLILESGAVPGMLGGDHSCTAFALEAHVRRCPAMGIIHFDAHHDMWPPPAPQYHYITHANVFHDMLRSPSLQVMRQLGLRAFEAAPGRRLKDDRRVSYFSARELQRMSPEEAFAGLPRDIPYYLTFDIDCIDPVYAPETGTPLPGGLTFHQAVDLVDYAAREFMLVGWDIVEVGQSEGAVNGAALCAARLVRQLLLAAMPFEPLSGYTRPMDLGAPSPISTAVS